MDQFQIGMLYNGLFISNAIYMAVFIFLLWMMFRGANQSRDTGANLVQKILASIISLCVIVFNLNIFSQTFANKNNYAFSLSQLDSVSPAAQVFVDTMGATEAISPSLIPGDPVSLVFWVLITFVLLFSIWTAPDPKS